MLKVDIDRDLKTAMLARDKRLVSILRSLKSAILYKEVEEGKREKGLDDIGVVAVFKKERKSRRDASEMYHKAREKERGDEEDYQIEVIERYLPEEMTEEAVSRLVISVISSLGIETPEMKDMGKIIGTAKQKEPSADGGLLSKVVKELIAKG